MVDPDSLVVIHSLRSFEAHWREGGGGDIETLMLLEARILLFLRSSNSPDYLFVDIHKRKYRLEIVNLQCESCLFRLDSQKVTARIQRKTIKIKWQNINALNMLVMYNNSR